VKILVVADISPTAIAVMEYLKTLLTPMQGVAVQVTVLHITEPELAYSETHPETNSETLLPVTSVSELHHIFDSLSALCQLDYVTTDGKFAEVVLKQSELADLIVMGRRRRSRLEEMLLGSHSQLILHQANCPLLLVPEPKPEDVARQVLAAMPVSV
jgi:nucleotide-binding universal stress UspA family protein